MIFSVQRYLEDYFERRNLSDVDQYAVKLANGFVSNAQASDERTLAAFHRIRTIFYQNNPQLKRREFEVLLLKALKSKFKKKILQIRFPGGVDAERRRLRQHARITIQAIIRGFVTAVEGRAIDSFWESRSKKKLARRPEKLGQALFAMFARGVLNNNGLVFRELASGIGFVDIAVVLSGTLHIIEMKLIRNRFTGVEQLATYMRTEQRQHGWLLFFDARASQNRAPIPTSLSLPTGKVTVVGVDINPIPPSKKDHVG